MRSTWRFWGAVSILFGLSFILNPSTTAYAYDLIIQKSAGLPITTFNLTFRVGSADDPKGGEGTAYLTAELMREGGLKAWKGQPARTRAALEDYLYPFAADIDVHVGKEQTSFTVTSSVNDSVAIFELLAQIIRAPAFDQGEFERLRSENLDALQKQWPREDQEELGKAALDARIWGKGHPYAHVVQGTVGAMKAMSIERLQQFYGAYYTSSRLTIGIAGVISSELENKIKVLFNDLKPGVEPSATKVALVPLHARSKLLIVNGPFEATGVHLGEVLDVNRSSQDFDNLYLMNIGFGKHRSFVGRLMRKVREIRSLNYGAYSYVEDFPSGGHSLVEPTQAARTRQAFTVWGRPTPIENGCFLLRMLHREVADLFNNGLTDQEFALARGHLIGNAPILGIGLERRLGYAIDSKFYGVKGDYLTRLQKSAKSSTKALVKGLIKKHLDLKKLQFVVVTPHAEKFKADILSNRCDVQYAEGSLKEPDTLEEDKKIATHRLEFNADDITIVSAEEIFD